VISGKTNPRFKSGAFCIYGRLEAGSTGTRSWIASNHLWHVLHKDQLLAHLICQTISLKPFVERRSAELIKVFGKHNIQREIACVFLLAVLPRPNEHAQTKITGGLVEAGAIIFAWVRDAVVNIFSALHPTVPV
jgi:hypothetical protein